MRKFPDPPFVPAGIKPESYFIPVEAPTALPGLPHRKRKELATAYAVYHRVLGDSAFRPEADSAQVQFEAVEGANIDAEDFMEGQRTLEIKFESTEEPVCERRAALHIPPPKSSPVLSIWPMPLFEPIERGFEGVAHQRTRRGCLDWVYRR